MRTASCACFRADSLVSRQVDDKVELCMQIWLAGRLCPFSRGRPSSLGQDCPCHTSGHPGHSFCGDQRCLRLLLSSCVAVTPQKVCVHCLSCLSACFMPRLLSILWLPVPVTASVGTSVVFACFAAAALLSRCRKYSFIVSHECLNCCREFNVTLQKVCPQCVSHSRLVCCPGSWVVP